jgi:HPt (histidine-containing phosphotransfer) domain-containing protein
MDVQMPVLGGFEATRLIREHERATGEHVPIIAVTARAMAGDREECLAAGMDGYLSKPLRAASVLEAVEALVPVMSASRTPARTASPAPAVFDRSELDETLGAEVVDSLLDLFFRDAPKQLGRLRDAVGKDAKTLREIAHTMKGAAGSITAARVAAAARAIEMAAIDGQDDLEGQVEDLDAAVEELRAIAGRS